MWAWGDNSTGELGDGTFDLLPRYTPGQVSGLAGVTAIAAGEAHGLAIGTAAATAAGRDNPP